MMKLVNRVVPMFTVLFLLAVPALAQQHFQAVLSGAQEVPPNASSGFGQGCFTLNPDNTLSYEVAYYGLLAAETMAHIHGPAPAGVNAGIVFTFGLGTPKIGVFGPLTAQQVSDLTNGLYYVNVHTAMFAGGEVRGQIFSSPAACTVPTEHTSWGAIKALYD